jgi:hypothetical protein
MNVSRASVLEEMEEVRKDHLAFARAKDSIQERMLQLENNKDRHERFVRWPGTQAALNVLIMCIVRCEGLLEDYQTHLDQAHLRLVQDKENE